MTYFDEADLLMDSSAAENPVSKVNSNPLVSGDFDSRSLLNCTSIKAGRIKDNPTVEWKDFIFLDTVTRVLHSSEPVLDEGGVRLLRNVHTINIEFVFGEDSYVGEHFDFLKGRPFPESVTILRDYITRQGIVLDLNGLPTAINNVLTNGTGDVDSSEANFSGLLIDSFNGPITTKFDIVRSIGKGKVVINWTFKVTTTPALGAYELNTLQSTNDKPVISGELKLDIDEDGDLMIYYGGTVHAQTVAGLYSARDSIIIKVFPTTYRVPNEDAEEGEKKYTDLYAQINGFKVKKSFNVDKTGRSAKFAILYTQIKSNSAYPLGIRDIEFDHEFKSNLLSKDIMEGAGFTSWKHTFSGKIRIPARMSANYGWYILHTLIQQKMRNCKFTIKNVKTLKAIEVLASFGLSLDDKAGILKELKTNPDFVKAVIENNITTLLTEEVTAITALPLSYRMKHQHFKRSLSFEITFIVVSPFQSMMKATKFFDRLNNDYSAWLEQNKGKPPEFQTPYIPKTLSEQWLNHEKSTNPAFGYNPETAEGRLDPNFANTRPHRDNSGAEITDTGHTYRTDLDRMEQLDQIASILTTVLDPNDNDPAYRGEKDPYYNHPGTLSEADLTPPDNYDDPEVSLGSIPQSPIALAPIRNLYQIPEEFSWLKYEERYTILEDNPTIPTESIASLDADYFSSRGKAEKVLPLEEFDSQGNSLGTFTNPPSSLGNVRGVASSGFLDREKRIEEIDGTIQRNVYSAGTGRQYVKVQGSAIRIGHTIPIPSVLQIAGRTAYRVGQGRTMVAPASVNSDMPVHVAAWEQVYTFDGTLDGEDILTNIVTTGDPTLYS